MTTALISHDASLSHETPRGHPEQIARIERVMAALECKDLARIKAPMAAEEDLLRAHPPEHIASIRQAAPTEGIIQLDADTWMSPGSLEAALRAAGGAVRAVDEVLSGTARNAFVACRPPGHHAERTTPMGFCLFGTVAIAAKYALAHHGLSRVAILDFDVHHGNGTQDLCEGDARILFASTHQMPLYPGTGHAHETGGHNNIVNVPLDDGCSGQTFRALWAREVMPAVDRWRPELILVSAGFDAHRADPLAGINLTEEDFAWVTERICDQADAHCDGRVVSSLEGGYDLDALAASAAAHVDVLIARGG